MLKALNKLVLFFVLVVSLSPCALSETTIPVTREISDRNGQMELIQNEVKVEDLDIDPINTDKLKNTIVPDPKKEGEKIIALFLKTMLGVVICTGLLYLVLLFVKKFYTSGFVNDEETFENLDLSTPQNKQDALKSFLNRTN